MIGARDYDLVSPLPLIYSNTQINEATQRYFYINNYHAMLIWQGKNIYQFHPHFVTKKTLISTTQFFIVGWTNLKIFRHRAFSQTAISRNKTNWNTLTTWRYSRIQTQATILIKQLPNYFDQMICRFSECQQNFKIMLKQNDRYDPSIAGMMTKEHEMAVQMLTLIVWL